MTEYWILDLKGNLIKKTYLPTLKSDTLLDLVLGTKLNDIYKDTLYYLAEKDDEEWELNKFIIK